MSVVTVVVPPAVNVGVFWDFENVRIPNHIKTARAANCIRDAVIGHGQIVERRLYYDSKKRSESNTDRENLDQGGFTLVDCPTRNRKQTIDMKIAVDIMNFAHINAHSSIPSCVVLIASDGDYAYALNIIRDRGVKTIVIHGPATSTANVLFTSCEHALSFQHDVLCIRREDEDEEEDGSEVQDAIHDALDGRHVVLCHSLAELGDSWVQDAKVAQAYYKKRGFGSAQEAREGGEGVDELSPYSKTRDSAVAGGFIQMGRKELQTGTVVESSGPWDQQRMGSDFSSTHLFVKLTSTGRRQLEDNAEAAREAMDAIQREPSSPSVDSVTPSEELGMEELRIDGAEAVAAPNAAGGARDGRGGGGRGGGRGRGGRGSGGGGDALEAAMRAGGPLGAQPDEFLAAALCPADNAMLAEDLANSEMAAVTAASKAEAAMAAPQPEGVGAGAQEDANGMYGESSSFATAVFSSAQGDGGDAGNILGGLRHSRRSATLCTTFLNTGHCHFEDRCGFNHGEGDEWRRTRALGQ